MPVARFSSIGGQLVFRFTLAAALLLSLTLSGFYFLVVRHAINEDNELLANEIAQLSDALRQPDSSAPLRNEMKGGRLIQEMAFYARVLEEGGGQIAQSPGMPMERDQFPPPQLWDAMNAREQLKLRTRDYLENGRLYALAAAKIAVGGSEFIVQVAQDRTEDERFRNESGLLLLAVLLVAIAASAAIALPVARHSLQPLRELTRMVERTDEAHLGATIAPEKWPQELQPLGAAFDHMLHRLNESFGRLSQFSADLAHELRTPIANMMGEAQVALTRPRPAEEYRGVLESTVAECERLSGIVESLLFLARAEAGTERMLPRRFDARAVLQKIVAYFQPVADERGVTTAINGSGEIVADQILFERAVTNLIDNALQHTEAGGNIVVEFRASDREAKVEVEDSGRGIAAKHLPRVFDRFYRADPSRSASGNGLGLALVKSIADLHGGDATIASEPGRGTRVSVSFQFPPADEMTEK